jgi:hypothetical protein
MKLIGNLIKEWQAKGAAMLTPSLACSSVETLA